jgi:predicted RNA binding protein YcfA (HicA-like mRNA interferase family)
MSRLPSVPGDRVVKALQKNGWYVHRQTGSHAILRHPLHIEKLIIVPIHGRKPVAKGTFGKILKDADLTIEDFKQLL